MVLKYPTDCAKRTLMKLDPPPLNSFADNCLKSVYDNSNQRSMIFSSFNPTCCTMMNWKQPNYGVFFRTRCGFQTDEPEPSKSLKESVKFAKSYDLLGIICDARPIVGSIN